MHRHSGNLYFYRPDKEKVRIVPIEHHKIPIDAMRTFFISSDLGIQLFTRLTFYQLARKLNLHGSGWM